MAKLQGTQQFLHGAQGVLQFPVPKNYTLTPAPPPLQKFDGNHVSGGGAINTRDVTGGGEVGKIGVFRPKTSFIS